MKYTNAHIAALLLAFAPYARVADAALQLPETACPRNQIHNSITELDTSAIAALTHAAGPATRPDPLDKAWRAIETPSTNLDSRAIMTFILEAAGGPDYQRRRSQIEAAFICLEGMQDRDPASKTYGSFCWYWHQSFADNNAVEFVVQKAAVLKLKFYGHLSSPARESLDRILGLAIEGIHRQRVDVGYTNIFLMKIWNLLAIGESLKRPDLMKEGEAMLDEWIEFTSKNGIKEFLSPTYYGVDLDSLGLMAGTLSNSTVRNKAECVLRLFWTHIAANWFDPAGRLGGAHGRDYDYLTGHGYLDQHLLAAGWIKKGQAADMFRPVFANAVRWAPSEDLHRLALSAIPRFVFQKWDASDTAWASQYIGHHFSLGVMGSTQGPEDKPFALNLASPAGNRSVLVDFFMDGRGDPYGTLKEPTSRVGHLKAHHLLPLFRAVQSGTEALFLASYPFDGPNARKPKANLVCLQSHLDLPIEAEVWTADHALACVKDSEELPGNLCFLRMRDVAVGIRFLLALDTAGKPIPARVFNDGTALNARRLTVTHDANHPGNGRGTVAIWVRVEEGLDDAKFAVFRRRFIESESKATVEGTVVRIKAGEIKNPLVLDVDIADGKILRSVGGNPAMKVSPFSVNGSEYGTGILNNGAPAGFQFAPRP